MNTEDFTKRCSDLTVCIRCWFCNENITMPACQNTDCLKASVLYSIKEYHDSENGFYNLQKVQFKTNINKRNYRINYHLPNSQMTVFQLNHHPDSAGSFNITSQKFVLSITYESLILTPQNVKDKLPLLITFS